MVEEKQADDIDIYARIIMMRLHVGRLGPGPSLQGLHACAVCVSLLRAGYIQRLARRSRELW